MITRRLTSGWDMTFGQGLANYYRNNNQAIGQNIKSRLLLILGEWFLDVNDGTPWQSILGVIPANIAAAESWMRRRILGTEGVVEITAFSSGFSSVTRNATAVVTVRTIYGTFITITI